jgi:hypothetical protein
MPPSETPLERALTHSYKSDMMEYLRQHPEAFEEAVGLALVDKPPYSWRAAWLLRSSMRKNDARIRKRYRDFVRAIRTVATNQQRELFKILEQMEPVDACEGELFDSCVTAWETLGAQPSVRMNAMRLLVKIAARHPDLFRELALLTRTHYLETLSPGVRHSVTLLMRDAKRRARGGHAR